MSFEKANISWRISQYSKMMEAAKILFDNMVQRDRVWTQAAKSLLIHSTLIDCPIPSVYAKRGEDGVYDVLDGKQRLTSLCDFVMDRYSLVDLELFCIGTVPLEENDSYSDDEIEDFKKYDLIENDGKLYFDLNKKRFSELPLYLRNVISNYKLTMYYFPDLTSDEERTLYKRLNGGKALTTKERNIANCADLVNVMELSKHELIHEMFTKKGIQKKNFVAVIMKLWTMCFNNIDEVSFESKTFNRLIEDARISEEEMNELNDLFDYIVDVHQAVIVRSDKKTARKLYTETHLVSVAPFMLKAMEENIDAPYMADWFISFFRNDTETSNNVEYNEVAKAGSARPESIKRRNAALEESYNEFFENLEYNQEEDQNEEVHETISEESKSDESDEFMNAPEEEMKAECESYESSEEDEPLPEE